MSVLKIHLTYQCTAACEHCRFGCSPAPHPAVDADLVLDCIRTLKRLNSLDTVVLMGGEPALHPELTIGLAQKARQLGLIVRVETNASYADSPQAARAFLEPLCCAGARICFSADGFHEPFISIERLERAIKVCDASGGRYSFESAYLDRGGDHAIDRHTDEILAGLEARAGHPLRVYRGRVFFCGRAAARLAPQVSAGRGVPAELCEAVPWWTNGHLRTLDLIILDPAGNLSKGCGIIFANVHRTPLERILAEYDAEAHPIFSVLLKSGPLGLARQAEAMGYRLKADYADRCHLCTEARAALAAEYPDWLVPF